MVGKIILLNSDFSENGLPNLPNEYSSLSYIKGSGPQYINTGVKPGSKKIGCVIDFQLDSYSAQNGITSSCKTDGKDNLQFSIYTTKWRCKINDFGWYGTTPDTLRHTLRLNMTDGSKLDSTVITNTQYTINSGNTNDMYLFACHYDDSSTSGQYQMIGKMYSAKFYDFTTKAEGELIRDFVPAKRKSDNVIGMYDFVTETFYTNAGTGSFSGS